MILASYNQDMKSGSDVIKWNPLRGPSFCCPIQIDDNVLPSWMFFWRWAGHETEVTLVEHVVCMHSHFPKNKEGLKNPGFLYLVLEWEGKAVSQLENNSVKFAYKTCGTFFPSSSMKFLHIFKTAHLDKMTVTDMKSFRLAFPLIFFVTRRESQDIT